MRSGVVLRRFAGEAILDRVRSIQCRTYWWGKKGMAKLVYISLSGVLYRYV